MLSCGFEGLSRPTASTNDSAGGAVAIAGRRQVVAAARRTIVGMILEQTDDREWSPAFYERLVRLKNVDYWRILNAALDPDQSSPLYPFLVEYYALAQRLNDVQDHSADEPRGQPNLLTILRRPQAQASRAIGEPSESTLALVEDVLARDFLRMGALLADLPEDERGVAALKLGESLDEMRQTSLRPIARVAGGGQRANRFDWSGTRPPKNASNVWDLTHSRK